MQCSRKWNWAELQQTCHLVHCPRFESGIRHHLMAAIFSLQPGSKQWAEITVPQRGKAPVWWVCAQIRTAKKLLNLTNISDDRNRDRMRGFQIIIIYLKSFSFLNVLTDVKTSIKNSQWRICFRLVNVIFKILHEHLYCNTTGTLTYPKITQFDTVRITSFFSFVHKYVFEGINNKTNTLQLVFISEVIHCHRLIGSTENHIEIFQCQCRCDPKRYYFNTLLFWQLIHIST